MFSSHSDVFHFPTKWNRADYYEMLEISKSWLGDRDILDIGCGRGESTHLLNAVGFDLKVIPTWQMLDGTFLVADGTRLPFKDSVFDGLLMNNVLEHIPCKDTIISELKRVTASDSVYVFILPSPKFKFYRLIEFPKNIIRILRGYEPIDWWVHAKEVHGINWFSEFYDFLTWENFLSRHFNVDEKMTCRGGLQSLFKCSNK